jgi:hypothetical protein
LAGIDMMPLATAREQILDTTGARCDSARNTKASCNSDGSCAQAKRAAPAETIRGVFRNPFWFF